MEDQAYLEPDFDPNTLTVPRLRSILVAHNVNYPSSAKKGQLVDLFNEQVLPQARKLKAASLRVKRTSRGIENVPAREIKYEGEGEEEAPPTTAARGGRRTTRARTEEAQEVGPTPRSTRHSTAPPEATPKRTTSKHARTVDKSELEQEPETKRPASRKSRLSAQTPVVKSEVREDDSPFSNDNVFQSGGSPPAEDRRRTSGVVKDADRRRSREHRRRTDDVKAARPQTDGAVVPTRKTFDAVHMPISRRKEEVEPSEEFTPEEQQELVRAEQSGELVPARPRVRRPASAAARNGVGAIAVALLAGMATLWGQEKYKVGYCGEGRASREIAGVEIPDWADVARPQCEPCPPHAICNENLETTCEPGFVLTPHPLTLNGMLPLPLPPSCEPDSVKAKKVDQVKQRAVEELREQNAKYECGETTTPEVKERELKAAISSKRTRRMNNAEFEDLWASAIGEVREVDEVTTGTDG